MRKDSGAIVFLEEQFSKFVNDMGTNVALNFLQPVLQIPRALAKYSQGRVRTS